MPDPYVVSLLRDFKADLLAREASQMQEMARRWLNVEHALNGEITALAHKIEEMKNRGETVSESALFHLDRYKRLLTQTQDQFLTYAQWASEEVRIQQETLLSLGIEHAAQAIQASYWPSVGVLFDRLPIEAVINMAGLAGNGMPIGELLKLRMIVDANGAPLPGVWDKLTQTLIDGTALGWNPRKTAKAMQDLLTAGLQKALVIARTEQLRVYRFAAWEQYEKSNVVDGQRRLSAHDGNVCSACLADEGTVYHGPIPDHPNGRCTGVPNVIDMPRVTWLSGENWLKAQNEDIQRSVLGGGTFDAWNAGLFNFSDLVTKTYDQTWGGGLQPTPLSKLVGNVSTGT